MSKCAATQHCQFSVMIAGLLITASLSLLHHVASASPNIVLFVADDLGYGDIGRFGNTTLRTPNIDKIGADGATLTQHIAAAPLCTPSRSAFLTGRYPIRSGMAATTDVTVILFAAGTAGLPPTEVTFAELAKKSGYRTALIGKWHQGLSCSTYGDHCHHPNTHGFDYFYGIPVTNMIDFGDEPEYHFLQKRPGLDMKFITACVVTLIFIVILRYLNFVGVKTAICLIVLLEIPLMYPLALIYGFKYVNSVLMRQGEIIEQPINVKTLTPRFVQESTEFIESAHRDNAPFLLVVSWHYPHTAIITMDDFTGRSQHGRYGDAVEEMDWGIGEIVQFLDEKGLSENTVVYFTSDHGGDIHEYGYRGDRLGGHNGIYKDGKGNAVSDGGVRVPAVMKWPGHIQPGIWVDQATSLMDLLPTIAHITGSAMPENKIIDGRDLLPLLVHGNASNHHEFLFHYCGERVLAVRYMPQGTNEVYKLVYYEPVDFFCSNSIQLSPPMLRSLHEDPSERHFVEIRPGSRYGDIISVMDAAKREHERTVGEVESQITFVKQLWRPWLQPCCRLPLCRCEDEKYRE